jgi:hypothetical protein
MRRGDVVSLTGDGMQVRVWFRSDGPRQRVWVVCPPCGTERLPYPLLVPGRLLDPRVIAYDPNGLPRWAR